MVIRNLKLLRYKDTLNKKFLEKEYLLNKKSISQLKKETGRDWHTISYYLKWYRIPLRTHKEHASISSP